MKQLLSRYRLEIIAALSGAVVMILELVGARMMAPHFGTSMYVWTAMIGVILGALSFGYWYGGNLADRGASDKGLMYILAIAALFVAASLLLQADTLSYIAALGLDTRVSAIVAATLLFAPASALLGVVSPYVAKLKLSSLAHAGSSIGRLYAAGTLGSIAGTFLAGYWLIAWFGNFTLGIIVMVALIAISFVAEHRTRVLTRIIGITAATGLLLAAQQSTPGIIADKDSAYARYQVSEQTDFRGQIRYLLMDNVGAQSGVIVGSYDALIFDYTQKFKALADAYGSAERTLVIGGGAYTFPRVLAQERPEARVDVVEIDPALDAIATDYFGYTPVPNLNIIHEDGRVFLNRNQSKYQLIYIDAFSSLTPPYQLATQQATRAMRESLVDDGILAANVIAAPNANDPYFTATLATYRSVFADVDVYQVQGSLTMAQRQNLLFVMGDTPALAKLSSAPLGSRVDVLPESGDVLTDDHAPVEQLIQASE